MAGKNISAVLLLAALLPALATAQYYNDIGEIFDCIFSVGPFDCDTAKGNANTASASAQDLANQGVWSVDSLHNGAGDAYRHCYWNALMTRSIGADQAKEVADGHEDNNEGPQEERDMDLFNNEKGREIGGNSGSDQAASDGCRSAALDGTLRRLF